ncbi:serine/threonine-protein phosphatase [Spongiactinospora gelatinilytica]|uniref:Serine/threonine protein phosphatase PstP n=1 Tax=Spongiactinospora gelatinilytica TaxID=2666298 RepID=A0A2W2G8N7_9ACTN|nr:Stp1/IreP family PP2C-type Ser/Thr phosphatase [Spongiactinospora gelatinilytica]PZG44212.1 serine/threonine-protein phosphatase [Spongiactinospora gelatinilytica]
MTIALRYAARSDVGLLREGNEDSAYASGRLLAVADGMGGHAHGEVASSVAIAAMAALEKDTHGGDLLSAIEAAVRDANRKLHEMVGRDPSLKGMGTTLTAMLWNGTQVALVHVGDSRAYLLRRGELYQITHDHTLVQSLVDDGRITPEEAATHPQRSILLRALDGSGEVDPDLTLREAQVDDRYLLCSDGLSGVVSAETMHNTLTTVDEPEEAVRVLIDLANRGGGPDNITCVVADVIEVEDDTIVAGDAAIVGAAGATRVRTQPHEVPGGQATITAPQPVITDEDLEMPMGEAAPMRRKRVWPLLAGVFTVAAVLVLGGGYVAWRWTQDQFFIGASGGEIVVYRGVDAELGPLRFFKVEKGTGQSVATLDAFHQGQIRNGIPVATLDEGLKRVAELRAPVSTQKPESTPQPEEPQQPEDRNTTAPPDSVSEPPPDPDARTRSTSQSTRSP